MFLVLFVCKEETHNEIYSWRSVGLLHARQKALADNYATVYIGLIIMCSVVLPAIALSMLGLSVMRERASRPPQTSVPVVVGVNYETAQIKLRDANLKIRVLAKRHDPQFEPGIIIAQTPQGGERVDCGTVIGVTLSAEGPWR